MPLLLKNPGTGSAPGPSITIGWANPGNIISNDGSYASTSPATSGNVNVTDYEVMLCSAVDTPIGGNRATKTVWSTTEAYFTYGGPADLWDTTLNTATVFNNGFGVLLKVTVGSDGETNYLNATNFQWSNNGIIMTGDSIVGCMVEIRRKKTFNSRTNETVADVNHVRMTIYYSGNFTGLQTITGVAQLIM